MQTQQTLIGQFQNQMRGLCCTLQTHLHVEVFVLIGETFPFEKLQGEDEQTLNTLSSCALLLQLGFKNLGNDWKYNRSPVSVSWFLTALRKQGMPLDLHPAG